VPEAFPHHRKPRFLRSPYRAKVRYARKFRHRLDRDFHFSHVRFLERVRHRPEILPDGVSNVIQRLGFGHTLGPATGQSRTGGGEAFFRREQSDSIARDHFPFILRCSGHSGSVVPRPAFWPAGSRLLSRCRIRHDVLEEDCAAPISFDHLLISRPLREISDSDFGWIRPPGNSPLTVLQYDHLHMGDGISFDLGSAVPYIIDRTMAVFGKDVASAEWKVNIERIVRLSVEQASTVQCVGMARPIPIADIYQTTRVLAPALALSKSRQQAASSYEVNIWEEPRYDLNGRYGRTPNECEIELHRLIDL
jgi:hypothetical protein